ncbi:OmpA family protein [Metallibacterium sp.]|jgi:peptidoglycan-associated lipoprotein|uniref:OmpA family protein n=1 Tax=Metallibacterium sp. TaxID=2940281 RepID=UPI002605E55E|nr:OmpA family protein [Metallibacterium sp.]
MNTFARISLAALLCVGLAACASKQEVKPQAPAPAPQAPAPAPVTQPVSNGKFTPADLETNACLMKRKIFFAFNRANIESQYDDIVACHAKYLVDNPGARVTLQGNTDPRGSREYNLGLGERRANSVERAMEALGANADQFTVVSYGKERLVCHEMTHACWAKDRRVDIVYTKTE